METSQKITPGQIAATRTMKVFCERYGHALAWPQRLNLCLVAMEGGDLSNLANLLQPFERAGMGSFIDWYPQSANAADDPEYLEVLWNALYGHWREQMKSHWPKQQ
jgi:hypothetical protein